MKRHEELKKLIQNGQFEQAIELVGTAKDYHEGEDFVFTVLNADTSPPELVEAVLQAFLETRVNSHGHTR